jgi:hypothetical protein
VGSIPAGDVKLCESLAFVIRHALNHFIVEHKDKQLISTSKQPPGMMTSSQHVYEIRHAATTAALI